MTYPARPVTGKITSVSVSGKGSDLKPAENAREQPDAAKRTNTSISSGTALSTMTGEIGKTSSSEPLQPDLIKAIESDLCLDAYTSSKLSSRNRIAWFTQIAGNDRLTGSRINKAYEDIKNACEVGLSDSDRANDFCKHVDLVMAKSNSCRRRQEKLILVHHHYPLRNLRLLYLSHWKLSAGI